MLIEFMNSEENSERYSGEEYLERRNRKGKISFDPRFFRLK